MGAGLSMLADEVIELREKATAGEYRLQAGYHLLGRSSFSGRKAARAQSETRLRARKDQKTD